MDRKYGNFGPQNPGTKRLNRLDVVGRMAASDSQNSIFNSTDAGKNPKQSTKNLK